MKRIILIALLFITVFGNSQVSRNRLKTTGYGWINRVVPPNNYLDSTFKSFHNIIDNGAAATATNSIAFTNKTGNISQWTNDVPYATTATLTNYVPNTRQITINGTAFDLSANRAWTVGDALVANPLSQFASTTSSQLAGVISDETGTGSCVFNTAPTFVTSITSPIIQGGTSSGGNITIKSTSSISPGNIIFNTSTAAFFGASGAKKFSLGSVAEGASLDVTQTTTTSGSFNFIDFKQAATTGQTSSTEIYGLRFLGSSRQWATGNITTQRESYFSTTTYNAVGASVITDGYGMYVEAPTAGTNMTITRPWALGLNGNLQVTGNIVKSGGTSSQFLKADGTVDANTYLTSSTGWLTTGNSGFSYGTNFLGTTDNNSILLKTNNSLVAKLDSLGDFYLRRSSPGSSNQVKFVAQNTSSTGISSLNCYDETGVFGIGISQFNKDGGVGSLYDDSTGHLSGVEKHIGIINEYATGDVFIATGGYGSNKERFRATLGGVAITGSANVTSSLNVAGAGAIGTTFTVSGAMLANSTFTTGSNAKVTGSLNITSNLLTAGNATTTGNAQITGSANVTSSLVASSLFGSNLTSGRIPYVTTSGQITDSGNLLYSSSTGLSSSTDIITSTNIKATGSGKVSIGTTAVSAELAISKSVASLGTCGMVIQNTSSTGFGSYWQLSNNTGGAALYGYHINTAAAAGGVYDNNIGVIEEYLGTQLAIGVPAATGSIKFYTGGNAVGNEAMRIDASNNVSLPASSATNSFVPTAYFHLGAGTTAASHAPEKYTTGSLMTTSEAGAKEYNNSFYSTKNSGLRYGEGGVIADFYTDAQNGTTAETDLYSYTTPANTLENDGGKITAQYSGTFNDLTATVTLKLYFGGTAIGNTGALTVSATGGWIANVLIIRTSSTTARAVVNILTPGASTAVYTTETDLTGLTLSGTNILKITGTAGGASGGSSDITGKLGTVSWMPPANN